MFSLLQSGFVAKSAATQAAMPAPLVAACGFLPRACSQPQLHPAVERRAALCSAALSTQVEDDRALSNHQLYGRSIVLSTFSEWRIHANDLLKLLGA